MNDLVQIDPSPRRPVAKPAWLKARAPVGENYHALKSLARSLNLHTVCESAHCPNIGECWNQRTATFMMLGNLCTRRCGFCAVPKGKPEPIDHEEPSRVAYAVAHSPLVKTAIAGEDANWGRVVMAVGKAGEPANRDRLSISFNGIRVAKSGARDPSYDETEVSNAMKNPKIQIRIALGLGKGRDRVLTCDLTKEYIAINGDYRS